MHVAAVGYGCTHGLYVVSVGTSRQSWNNLVKYAFAISIVYAALHNMIVGTVVKGYACVNFLLSENGG